MKNKPFILICLLTTYLSTYRPMRMKNFDFGSDVCHYKEASHNNGFEYVNLEKVEKSANHHLVIHPMKLENISIIITFIEL